MTDRPRAPGAADRELLDLAVAAAHGAGAMLLNRFGGPARGVTSKTTPTDLVSDADREAERFIVSLLEESRPDDGILSEEGREAGSASGLTWVIDPLDGTVNYLFGIPQWAVSVAVQDAEGGVVGVVHHPGAGETFSAVRGQGARLNGGPVTVSERSDLASALIGTGFSYDAGARREQAQLLGRVLPRVRDVRRAGSAALDLCSVACGRLDGFYEAPTEPWDKAAGVLIIEEAKGTVSEMPPPIQGVSAGVIAAGAGLHDRLRSLVLGEGG